MTTVICGQLTDLPHSHEEIIMQMLRNRYPLSGVTPAKTSIYFSTMGWAGIRTFQISVEQNSAPRVTAISFGRDRIEKYEVPIVVHIWVRRNDDKKPKSIFTLAQQLEHIINENTTNAGYGITSVRITQGFATIQASSVFTRGGFGNETEQSVWHTQCLVQVLYFKSIIQNSYDLFNAEKTHKYNVLV